MRFEPGMCHIAVRGVNIRPLQASVKLWQTHERKPHNTATHEWRVAAWRSGNRVGHINEVTLH